MAWRELIARNLGWKLSSLVLAALIWLAIYTNSGSGVRLPGLGRGGLATRSFSNVPVTVRVPANTPWQWRVEPTEVELTVSGEPKAVQALQPADLEVVVDLTDLEDFTSVRKQLRRAAPAGISVESVKPAFVRVEKIGGPHSATAPSSAL